MSDPLIDRSKAWEGLGQHQRSLDFDLRGLFESDPGRAQRFSLEVADLRVDFSKNLITDQTVSLLVDLANDAKVTDKIEAMFLGQPINESEGRAALHSALRSDKPVFLDGQDITKAVAQVHQAMGQAALAIRGRAHSLERRWVGATRKPITNVVNIGIGGSDLGPRMATKALSHMATGELNVRFVSNVDAAHLHRELSGLNPEQTLFVVVSKSFTTQETMVNANSAKRWLTETLVGDTGSPAPPGRPSVSDVVRRHFVGVTSDVDAAIDFGIDPGRVFEIWDWVGGRYSLGSAVGFAFMCAVGPQAFSEFLDGQRQVDDHFRSAPLSENVPVLAGLLGIWYRNFWQWQTHAVIPYTQDLELFPQYLQQLDMESNGKGVTADGRPLSYDSAPILWGQAGTGAQHSFFQLFHQGTTKVSCDLIGFLESNTGLGEDRDEAHHEILFANLLAQSAALAFGEAPEELSALESPKAPPEVAGPHMRFPGNRPTTIITAPSLTPRVLGQLVALYEHRVFTQGAVWGINSFDQWGVELGKTTANKILADLSFEASPDGYDSSTLELISRYRSRERS